MFKATFLVLLILSLQNLFVQTDFWQPTGSISHTKIEALIINKSDHIFAGTDGGGVFRSINNGDSWEEINNGISAKEIWTLDINSQGHLYAGARDTGLFRSTDNGDHWAKVDSSNIYVLAINPLNDDIFISAYNVGIYRSTDNGDTWELKNDGIPEDPIYPPYVLSFAINSSGDIFAGTSRKGLFRSTDNGDSWHKLTNGIPSSHVATLAINSMGHIFASDWDTTAPAGFFRSIDNGDSWTKVGTGITTSYVHSLVINSIDDIFLGTFGNGVFYSTDNGDSCIDINTGIPVEVIPSLAINSKGEIFAGTTNYGVYKSTHSTTSIAKTKRLLPKLISLKQNYPNPFNPATTIRYNLNKSSNVILKIYNPTGQLLVTLVNSFQTEGEHEITWQPKGLPSGIYFYRLQADDPSTSSGQRFSETKKLILQK